MPVVLLREQDEPHRVLPIFIGAHEALAIALGMSDQSPPRPFTHDLLAALIESLDAHVDHIEVTEVREGTFVAHLALWGPHGGVDLDTRPSDAIALALRVHAPLFASDAVLDDAGAYVVVETGDQAVDEEDVDQFRDFLDQIDPSDFDDPNGPGTPPDDLSD